MPAAKLTCKNISPTPLQHPGAISVAFQLPKSPQLDDLKIKYSSFVKIAASCRPPLTGSFTSFRASFA
jgi:hypothetical protein